ncbi:TlpA disulfide reductase family protein [Herpetosiphon gulosus]|uniref:Thioredoxin domain-containing protein n=1 Tax=Herpetosiphon gulosus TaxID=1973496 RepID=A0ABP9X6N7_9CHLR
MHHLRWVMLGMLGLSLLSACGSATNPTAPSAPRVAATMSTAATVTASVADAGSANQGSTIIPAPPSTTEPTVVPTVANLAAWQTLPLINARTGESFTLADFHGKTIYIEPMATWCSNCRKQLTIVAETQAQLKNPDVVFIGLSVETDLAASDLAAYADAAGFDWLFAVSTPELLRELTAVFGRTITNPPATPHFIIRPDGTTTELSTGIEPSDGLIRALQAAGATAP